MKPLTLLLALIIISAVTNAQKDTARSSPGHTAETNPGHTAETSPGLSWFDAKWALGVCETDPEHIFNRLPTRMQSQVTPGVWSQSIDAAGEYLHFRTTARSFLIRYGVAGKTYALPHMPATGVSGVDLYSRDINGVAGWASPARYSFGDTCVYEYRNLRVTATAPADFYLYLPLYASLQWISIGVPSDKSFEYQKQNADLPIVAYGTSILQGACASRPGLAWTNILERSLDRTIVNLGFSGNGRFDAPVFDLMARTPAKLYILDCMPNLMPRTKYPADTIEQRLRYGIARLREQQPDVPLLFTEHACGYSPAAMDTALVNRYHECSVTIRAIFHKFEKEGIRGIYLLSEEEIGFDVNSTVEGTHPNDIGMMYYAKAYEKKIRTILKEPVGVVHTQIPVEQCRDGFDYRKRHEAIVGNTVKNDPRVIVFGNSIINYWGGEPQPEKISSLAEPAWQEYMAPLRVQNAGFGYDLIENVLWRIYHGELDHFGGDKIVVAIGTNNLSNSTDSAILAGLAFLVQQIHIRKPTATVYLGAILPRRNMLQRVATLNRRIGVVAKANGCRFFDFGPSFLQGGRLNDPLFMTDGLHPSPPGYKVLGESFRRLLSN